MPPNVAIIPKLQGRRALVAAGAQGIGLASESDGFITGATLDINGGVYGCLAAA